MLKYLLKTIIQIINTQYIVQIKTKNVTLKLYIPYSGSTKIKKAKLVDNFILLSITNENKHRHTHNADHKEQGVCDLECT